MSSKYFSHCPNFIGQMGGCTSQILLATDLHTGNAEYWLSQAYITCTPYKVYSIIFGRGELGRNLFCKYTVHVAVYICMYVPLTFYVIREQKLWVACVFPTLNAALLFLSAFTTTHSHH